MLIAPCFRTAEALVCSLTGSTSPLPIALPDASRTRWHNSQAFCYSAEKNRVCRNAQGTNGDSNKSEHLDKLKVVEVSEANETLKPASAGDISIARGEEGRAKACLSQPLV